MSALSLKAHRFMLANASSPVVYVGIEAHRCVYRLADGSSWEMSIRESRDVGIPRFAHLPEDQVRLARA